MLTFDDELHFLEECEGCRDQPYSTSLRFAVVETIVDIQFNQSKVKGDLRDVLLARLRDLNRRFHQLATETLAQTHGYRITETYSTWTSKRITRVILIATRRIAPSE